MQHLLLGSQGGEAIFEPGQLVRSGLVCTGLVLETLDQCLRTGLFQVELELLPPEFQRMERERLLRDPASKRASSF